ncbi:MAG TPA: polyphosphate kinase 1 [Methanomassiliicoccales archaeon]|nr:polyphosphate kinase 1 [Methanomassiliicoccales archaeon]
MVIGAESSASSIREGKPIRPRYFSRELSALQFQRRILEEAFDTYHPLLERVKFLAICGSNLDEFFMSRVSDLCRLVAKGAVKAGPEEMNPSETIDLMRADMALILRQHARCWNNDLRPKLSRAGIRVNRWADLDEEKAERLRGMFDQEMFPTLTPLAFEAGQPFPFISNLSLNLVITLMDSSGREKLARVKMPTTTFSRFLRVPSGNGHARASEGRSIDLIPIEELVANNLGQLFPGLEVRSSYPFRVTRDAEIEISLQESEDMLEAVEEGVEERRHGRVVRLEVDSHMPEHTSEMLAKKLGVPLYLVFPSDAPLGLADFWQIHGIDRPDLKDLPFNQCVPPGLSEPERLFAAFRKKDRLFYHPYDSFAPIVNWLNQAAIDPDVLAIKITLYRIDKRSPVIDALIEARKRGKQVAAVVELKAKFDEENNISFARTLEREGVHVLFGPVDQKVHAKMCLVVRKEKDGIVRYSHLSSGNYNNITTRVYGDLAYVTCDPQIGADVSHLFNALTGYAEADFKKLLVAPKRLRAGIIERIEREVAQHRKDGQGRIIWKLNGLLDKEVIDALYAASQEGVRIDLNVRGMCALRPGVKGLSDNITVTSIVGRFLEHSRIYYFRNGGEEEVLMGSSDMMPRNLDRRVELLFPIEDADVRRSLVDQILMSHLRDNVKARRLLPSGQYERIMPKEGESKFDSQIWFVKNRGAWHNGSCGQ